jgi:Mlc titration factor MtfA (ptsG expression regulator)
MSIAALILLLAALLFSVWWSLRKKKVKSTGPIPGRYKIMLNELIPFYRQLDKNKQKEFEERVQQFLAHVKITGINTSVEDKDRILIASGALIPIFNFPGWEYVNLHEVLLYPDAFNHDFEQLGSGRSIAGMVGTGALNHIMILSRQELRQAFNHSNGAANTAIHEFVHLVDKIDGSIDGVPAFILDQKYIVPWLQLMHREIQKIRENKSTINPYGAINEAEFFAVASEYFFEHPGQLKQHHPELYELLEKIFRPRSHY